MLEILLFCVYLLGILLLLFRWKFITKSGLNKKSILLLFVVKLGFSYLLYLVYTIYYTDRTLADIFKFYDDAKLLYTNLYNIDKIKYWKIVFGIDNDAPSIYREIKHLQYWFEPNEKTSYNDNRIIIRINLLMYPFTNGLYAIHALIFSFISYVGLIAFYRTAKEFFMVNSKLTILSIFLIPSVLFWGSGNLKESVLIFALGFYTLYLFQTLNKFNLFNICILLTTALLLLYTKSYVLLTLIPGSLSLFISKYFNHKKLGLTIILTLVVCLTCLLLTHYFLPKLDLITQIQKKQIEFNAVAIQMKAASKINLPLLDNNIFSNIINSSLAVVNTLFRPTIIDATSVLSFIAGVENFVIIILIVLAILFPLKPTEKQKQFIYFSICFTLLLSLFIGLIVPVLGAIVRYKIPYLPLLYLSILTLIDFRKIKQKIKLYRNGK